MKTVATFCMRRLRTESILLESPTTTKNFIQKRSAAKQLASCQLNFSQLKFLQYASAASKLVLGATPGGVELVAQVCEADAVINQLSRYNLNFLRVSRTKNTSQEIK